MAWAMAMAKGGREGPVGSFRANGVLPRPSSSLGEALGPGSCQAPCCFCAVIISRSSE